MEIKLTDKNLTKNEQEKIDALFARLDRSFDDDLEQMWHMMDLVWDDYGCDNKKLDWEKIGQFYSHPVWLLNGLFIEQHELSISQRHAISDWVVKNKFEKVVDYGGGFGTLARQIAEKDPSIDMTIYEPYPSEFGLKRAAEYPNITITGELGSGYDCLVSTDVLEHVPEPLQDFKNMIESVRPGGYLILASCFKPVIKCHLPRTFYLHYTFDFFAKKMGLKVLGPLEGSHATIYQKPGETNINWENINRYKTLAKMAYPVITWLKPVLRPFKRLLMK